MVSFAEKESDIQNAVCEYLTAKKHFFWRNNSIGVYDPTHKNFRRLPKYAMAGVPDVILIKDSFFVGLEIKSAKGKQSESQKLFEKKCTEAGGEYYVIRSIDDVIEIGL